MAGVTARFERAGDRFRLSLSDTGSFDISADGSAIAWVPAPNAAPELVRSDVLGRVLAVALHAAGDLCLHASAVAIDGRAIALVAPKGYGKSTLAMALVSGNGCFVADDTTRLTTNPPRVAVGVPALRLRADSAAHFRVDDAATIVGGKRVLRDFEEVADERWLPLDAVYVLSPRRRVEGGEVATRRQLSELEATLALVQHGKSAALLGKDEAGTVLSRASALARSVPVYVLDVVRDLQLLSKVAARVAHWHAHGSPAGRRVILSVTS